MSRSHSPSARRWLAPLAALVLAASTGLASGSPVVAAESADAVLDWNQHAVAALANPATAAVPGAGQPPTVAVLHLAMVQAAVYDAVNAIDRRHAAYLDGLPAVSRSASKAAAAATAAHHVLVGITPPLPQVVIDRLDGLYAAFLAETADTGRRAEGLQIGAAAAAAMLAERAGDGRYVAYSFEAGDEVGEWRPELPTMASDPFAWVANVRPFTLASASQFRTPGPLDMTSPEYAAELNEVKALGAATGSSRTEAQTELARFMSANPVPMLNAALRGVALDRGLSLTDTARLFATTSLSSADAIIGCWEDKVHWLFWRPITAIRQAADDDNPLTEPQADWLPLFATPPYPDHPSGFNCLTASMMHAARGFFGTDQVAIQVTSPGSNTTRTYERFTAVIADAIEGRILTGFHFRTPDVQGAELGRNVAAWVQAHELGRVK
jgi:hypothetical protein